MLNSQIIQNISSKSIEKSIIWGIGGLSIFSSVLAIRYNTSIFFTIPAIVLVAAIAIFDFQKLFFLLFASIPFSVEIYLPGGLATDLPTEPLMWVLMGVSFIYALLNFRQLDTRPLKHPLSISFFSILLGYLPQ